MITRFDFLVVISYQFSRAVCGTLQALLVCSCLNKALNTFAQFCYVFILFDTAATCLTHTTTCNIVCVYIYMYTCTYAYVYLCTYLCVYIYIMLISVRLSICLSAKTLPSKPHCSGSQISSRVQVLPRGVDVCPTVPSTPCCRGSEGKRGFKNEALNPLQP